MAAGMTPPLGLALATFMAKDNCSDEEKLERQPFSLEYRS